MKKKESVMLLCLVVFGVLQFVFLYGYTVPNETVVFEGLSSSEYLTFFYLNHHPRFDYVNGLWLDFSGLFFCFLLLFLGIPNPFKIVKDWIRKMSRLFKE